MLEEECSIDEAEEMIEDDNALLSLVGLYRYVAVSFFFTPPKEGAQRYKIRFNTVWR